MSSRADHHSPVSSWRRIWSNGLPPVAEATAGRLLSVLFRELTLLTSHSLRRSYPRGGFSLFGHRTDGHREAYAYSASRLQPLTRPQILYQYWSVARPVSPRRGVSN